MITEPVGRNNFVAGNINNEPPAAVEIDVFLPNLAFALGGSPTETNSIGEDLLDEFNVREATIGPPADESITDLSCWVLCFSTKVESYFNLGISSWL